MPDFLSRLFGQKNHKQLEDKMALLAAIVENSDDAIISKSLDGIILSWNAGAERMFGYPAHQAIGQHISLIIPPERLIEEERIIAAIGVGKVVDHLDTQRQTRQGALIDISLSVSPIRNSAGKIIGASKIAPGRFVIAINQAPIPMHLGIGLIGGIADWIIQRRKTFANRDWPPTHLLRHVMETAPDYQTACDMLQRTPLAIPVIFTICGMRPGEACVIERTETSAHVITENVCTANHWQNPNWRGHARPIKSTARLAAARKILLKDMMPNFSWLKKPILNSHSIMAFQASALGRAEIITMAHGNQMQSHLKISHNHNKSSLVSGG